jgi:acyl carrier protein phosphodiesterase
VAFSFAHCISGNNKKILLPLFISQAQQDQIDTVNQLAEKLLHVADQSNREKIQRQNTDINLKWTNTINSIDNQIETLSQIAQNWTDLERDINIVERSLQSLTDKVKDIEFGQKSQALLEDVKNNILVSLIIIFNFIFISRLLAVDISTKTTLQHSAKMM